MQLTLRVPSVRSLTLLGAGVVLGVVAVGPVTAKIARPDLTRVGENAEMYQSRTSSCAGLAFKPIDEDAVYRFYGYTGIYQGAAEGQNFYVCSPNLPNSAVVTRFRVTVDDQGGGAEVSNCALV